MNHQTLFGEGFSYLVPLLLRKEGNGQVHSIFTNGFNLKMGDSLVFIGNDKNGLLPFGIHLREEDTWRAVSAVKNGDFAAWNSRTDALEFPGVTISLGKGQSFKNELNPLKSRSIFDSSFERLCARLTAIEEPMGLDVAIPSFISKFQDAGEQDWHGAEAYLIMLIEVAISNDRALIEKVLRYLLGRGNGLTPSGDDLIVGLLAFDAICPFLSSTFCQKLSQLIEGESITTDVAREYLRYALEQEYSSTVSNMVNTLADEDDSNFEEVFRNLLGVGHSSGLDTLFGILIGMLAFKNPKEQ